MNERSEQELDELLSRHLGACLDSQLGRATAAFRAEQRGSRPAARWRWWAGGAVGIAAGVAMAWMIIGGRSPHGSNVKPGGPVAVGDVHTEVVPPMVQSATWSPVTEVGLAVVDD